MCRSCSRKMCCAAGTTADCCVCSPICFDNLRTSMRCASSASTLSRRSLMSIVSRTACFSEGFASMMPAMKSASADAESNSRSQRPLPRGRSAAAGSLREPGFGPGNARLHLGRHDFGNADFLDPRHQETESREELDHAEAPHALRDHMMRAVGRGDVAKNLRGGSDPVQLLRLRSSTAGSVCRMTPSIRSLRTASWAAAMEDCRAIAKGSTIPETARSDGPAG